MIEMLGCLVIIAPVLITVVFLHFQFVELERLLDEKMNNSVIERLLPDKIEKRFTNWLKKR